MSDSQYENIYRDFFAQMEQGFCILEMLFDEDNNPVDYRFEEVNATFERQTGLSNPVGKTARQLVPGLEDHWFQLYGKVALTGEPERFIEGSEAMGRWFEVHAYRLGNHPSRKVGLVFRDISRRKQQDQELKQLKDQLSNIVDHAGSGLTLFDSAGMILQANEPAAYYQGYSSKEIMQGISMRENSRRFLEKYNILNEEGGPAEEKRAALRKLLEGESNAKLSIIQESKTTGEKRWLLLESRKIPLTDEDYQVLLIINDITLQIRHQEVEASLQATENRFRFMADNISQLAWMTDETGYIFWYNQRWFNYTGTTLEEMKGWGWTKVHHPDHVDRVVKKINRCFAEGRNWEDTFPLRGKDGKYRWFLSRAVVIRDARGEITNWFGTNTDITDQLQASEELSYQKGLLEAQHRTSPMGILVVDPDRKILMYNRRFEEMHRLAGIDLVGQHESVLRKHTSELYEKVDLRQQTIERVYSTRVQNQEKLFFKDGRILEWYGTPVLGENGEYFGYAFSYIDVTKQETLLRQKDEFLGVASHELKTPVTSMLAYTELLQRRFENADDQLTYGMLSKINQQINRLTLLINDLLDVTRLEQGKLILRREEFDFNALVEEVVEEIQRTTSTHSIEISMDERRGVYADRDRIGQVIANFLTNAIKYSPKSNKVEVSIRYEPEAVRLAVRDHGLGLSPEDQEKVFERFFRVEGKDRETLSGLGLGLYISSEIIERHGGCIGLESELKKGSEFYFTLPIAKHE